MLLLGPVSLKRNESQSRWQTRYPLQAAACEIALRHLVYILPYVVSGPSAPPATGRNPSARDKKAVMRPFLGRGSSSSVSRRFWVPALCTASWRCFTKV